jgi:hypothetical protein
MTNTQNIIGLFIVLVVILSMGLQFFDLREREREGMTNNGNKKDDNIPVQSKTNNSMAKQNMLNDTVPNY